jgi:hypothetical protein
MQTSKLSLVNKNNKCVSIFYSYYGRLNYKFNPATLFIRKFKNKNCNRAAKTTLSLHKCKKIKT